MLTDELKRTIREVPDFPKPGINYYDITTLFRNATAFRAAVDRMVERYRGDRLDFVAGVDARGFILASIMAYQLEVGLVLIRKPGKLPADTFEEEYVLEYGSNRVEMHKDAVEAGQRGVVIDDLLATGGTAKAAGKLLERGGARVDGFGFLVELGFLDGRKALDDAPVFSLLRYD